MGLRADVAHGRASTVGCGVVLWWWWREPKSVKLKLINRSRSQVSTNKSRRVRLEKSSLSTSRKMVRKAELPRPAGEGGG